MPDLKSVNIDELLGFNLETRIRMMVADCIEPIKLKVDHVSNRVKVLEKTSKGH